MGRNGGRCDSVIPVIVIFEDVHQNGAGIITGQADHIKAGAVKGELGLGIDILIHRDLHGRAQRIGSHIGVGSVVAIDVVGIHLGEAVFAGTVLALGRIIGDSADRRRPRVVGILAREVCDNCIGIEIIHTEGYKIVLIVDRRCGNHGNSGVVIPVLHFLFTIDHLDIGVGNHVGEDFFSFHLHTVGGIQGVFDLLIFQYCAAKATGCCVCNRGLTPSGIKHMAYAILYAGILAIEDTVNRHSCRELVVTQHVNHNGNTVVDNHSVRLAADRIDNREPDGGVVIASRVGHMASLIGRISAVTGDIGGSGFSGCAADFPAAAGIVAGIGMDGIGRIGIIERVTIRQDRSRGDIDSRDAAVHVLIDWHRDRLGHSNLVGKTAGFTRHIVDDDVTLFVHQIESIVDNRSLPGQRGADGMLHTGVVLIVGVVQIRELIGGIDIGRHTNTILAHGVFQIDIVAQDDFLLGNVTDVPEEGLRGNIRGSIHLICGLIGVVLEVSGIDDAVYQDIISGVAYTVAVDIHLVRVGLGARIIECDGLQNCAGGFALTGTDHLLGDKNAVDLRSHLADLVQVVSLDRDGGSEGLKFIVAVSDSTHLQIEVLAHLVVHIGIGCSLTDAVGDIVKSLMQFLPILRFVELAGVAGNLAQDLVADPQAVRTLNIDTEADAVDGGVQTGLILNIGILVIW